MHAAYQARAAQISGQQRGHNCQVSPDWVVIFGDNNYHVTVGDTESGRVELNVDGTEFVISTDWQLGDPLFRAEIAREQIYFQVTRTTVSYSISQGGFQADAWVLSPHVAELNKLMLEKESPDTSKLLLSPMPGLLVSVAVTEGQEVKAGEELCVVEAMKMENVLRAEKVTTVTAVKAEAGASLMVDQIIMEFK
jgi:propionyl-CoA carboxylase alpha chain